MSGTDLADVSIITLTTDFGHGSRYAAAMKGVILSINPTVTLVDITHDIRPQDVHQGAFVLDDVTRCFPPGTIHVAVIDPGVGTDRPIVYAEFDRQAYIVPDNGLLSRVAERRAADRIVRLEDPAYWLLPVSKTFHGRDIMAPVAAHLAGGLDPAKLGPSASLIGSIQWSEPVVGPNRIDGVVLAIDSFGNLVTNIKADLFLGRPTDRRVCIVCGIYETHGIFGTYADHYPGSFIALVDSNDRVELALVGDNAAKRLGLDIGTPVTVAWE